MLQYGWFYRDLDLVLMGLTNVNCLKVVATEGTVMKRDIYENPDPNPIDWKIIPLPKLKAFELEFSAIGEGLIDFLGRHAKTLERISLRYCFTTKKDDWRRLFQLFIVKQPAQLTDFELPAYPVRLWRGQGREDWRGLEPISGFELLADTEESDLRQFVVAQMVSVASLEGKMQPIESLIDSPYGFDEAELDESDLIPLWKEVSRLIQRNRKPALL